MATRPDEISSPRRDSSRVDVVLVAMLIGVLAAVLIGLRLVDSTERDALLTRLDGDATNLAEHMSGALRARAGTGDAMAGLVGSIGPERDAGRLSQSWFTAFAGPLVAHGQASLLAFAPYVRAAGLDDLEERVRHEGKLDFTVFELIAGQPEEVSARDAYAPVQWIEPISENVLTVGFDLASDPGIREAIVGARDSGGVRATPPRLLPSGPTSLLVVPVYDGPVPATTEARRTQFAGVAIVGYRPQDLLDGLLRDGLVPAGLDILLRDTIGGSGGALLAALRGGVPSVDGPPSVQASGTLIGSPGPAASRVVPAASPAAAVSGDVPLAGLPGGILARRGLAVSDGAPLYTAEFVPGAAYADSGRSSLSLVVIIIGLLMVVALAFGYGLLRRRSNLDLLGLADRLSSVLRASPDAFIGLDRDGHIVEWSLHAQQLFGWTREQATGSPLATLIGMQDAGGATEVSRALVAPLGSRERRRIECDAVTSSGAVIPVEIQVSDRRQPERWSLSCFVRDVTERKRAEQELLRSRQMETVDNMARELTHDFNNLLTIVMGSLDLVGAEPSLSPAGKRRLGTAMTAALRGADLTRSLMYVSRVSRLDPIEIDVTRLLGEVDPLVRQALGPQHEVRLDIASEPLTAYVDPGGLSNAILNLVINARDAMPGDGRLSLRTFRQSGDERAPTGWIVIEVSDTGTGMPPEVVERAFEPFFTTKQLGKGTGLGLAAVHGFVERSGGDVVIESVVGSGTTIRIRLAAVASAPGIEPAPAGPGRPGTTARVLVVDDEDAVRETAVAWLTQLGYEVDEASSGESAIERLRQADHDLLVTDLVMSGTMDGLELVRRARLLVPGLSVVVVTGFAGREAQSAAEASGFRVVLKPYQRDELARVVGEALRTPSGPDGQVAASGLMSVAPRP